MAAVIGIFLYHRLMRHQFLTTILSALTFSTLGMSSQAFALKYGEDKCRSRLETKWSFEQNFPQIQIDDFFSNDYLQKIREELGEPELVMTRGPRPRSSVDGLDFLLAAPSSTPRTKIDFSITANAQLIVKFSIWESTRGKGLVLEHLRIENPLSAEVTSRSNQNKKGLPYAEFKRLIEQLSKIAKAADYEFVDTNGAQTYTVAMLYRRLLGMRPADERSAKMLGTLDNGYAAARDWPDGLKVRSLSEFDDLLEPLQNARMIALRFRVDGRVSYPSDVRLLYGSGPDPVAVQFQSLPGMPIRFLNPNAQDILTPLLERSSSVVKVNLTLPLTEGDSP